MAVTYDSLQTYTCNGSETQVTFSSIPQTYTDLVVIAHGKINSVDYFGLRFNGSSGSEYSRTVLYYAESSRAENQTELQMYSFSNSEETFCSSEIMNYSNTTTNKMVWQKLVRGGAIARQIGMWSSTAAINSVTCRSAGFLSGTKITLFGIKAA